MCCAAPDHREETAIEPREAIEGSELNLTCRATRYLYTSLQWLDPFNRTVTSGVSGLQLSSYYISLSLHLSRVSQNSTAGYKCLAYKMHHGVELKNVALTVHGKSGGERLIKFYLSGIATQIT